MSTTIISVLAIALLGALLYMTWQQARLRKRFEMLVQDEITDWKNKEQAAARQQLETSVRAELTLQFQSQLQADLESWRHRELLELRNTLEDVAQQQAGLALEQWKTDHERAVRADAVQRSYAVIRGRVHEQLAPYLPEFQFNPKDARFIGSPIDFIVFDGLAEDRCDEVVFVEVKTGTASLTTRERRVRDAIHEGRVGWRELRLGDSDSGIDVSESDLAVAGPFPYADNSSDGASSPGAA